MGPLVSQIDEHIANDKISKTYPYVLVKGSGDPLMVTMDSIKPGDIPVLIEYRGTTYNIGTIEKSALEIAKLLSVYKLAIYVSEKEIYDINTTKDLLEAGVW